jgi:hypothetical protein
MPRAGPVRAQNGATAGERFTAAMAAIVRRLPFGLARIAAGTCEGLYMYAAMRWLVFGDVRRVGVIPTARAGSHRPGSRR